MIYDVLNYPHRFAMYAIRKSRSEAALLYYRKAWRVFGKKHQAITYFGSKMRVDLMDSLDNTIFFFGIWEPNISKEIERRLKPGGTFVDIGANIGYYSLLASKAVGERGKVIAIEASPSIFELFNDNMSINRVTNVRSVNLAVSDKNDVLTVYDGGKGNRGATSTIATWRDGKASAQVKATTLNQILSPEEIRQVSLIKIDVEGAELPILRQLLDTIDEYPADMTIAVEFTPVENFSASWRANFAEYDEVFSRFIREGFRAEAVTNDYTYRYYLDWKKVDSSEIITKTPQSKMDIFFQRP